MKLKKFRSCRKNNILKFQLQKNKAKYRAISVRNYCAVYFEQMLCTGRVISIEHDILS